MKRVLFVAHGVGRHDEGWSQPVVQTLTEIVSRLRSQEETGFDAGRLRAAVSDTVFVELRYDDLYQELVQETLTQPAAFIDGLRSAGLSGLARLFAEEQQDTGFLHDNVLDVLIYRAMREFRYLTREYLANQMYKQIYMQGLGNDVQYSVMAHSLGTAILHDTLQLMSKKPNSPYNIREFEMRNLFMVANTSALLRSEFDPKSSNVRPFLKPGEPGYVRNYFDFAHVVDPIALIRSTRRYLKGVPRIRFIPPLRHFEQENIHDYTHYLGDPRVYGWVLAGLYGPSLLPVAYRARLLARPPRKTLAQGTIDALTSRLQVLIDEKEGAGLSGKSRALFNVATFIREVL